MALIMRAASAKTRINPALWNKGNGRPQMNVVFNGAPHYPEDVMADQKKQPNEGEGNRTAARAYNKDTKEFVDAGRVGKAAEDARTAMAGGERKVLEEARKEAATHAKEHDPAEVRDHKKSS